MTRGSNKSSRKTKPHSAVNRRIFNAGIVSSAAIITQPMFTRTAKSAEPLKIGMLLPRSGVQAKIGIDCQRGADIGLPILKERGYGDIEFMLGDTETKVDVARAQAEKLINEGANVIIGCFDSGQTMAAAQVCEQKNIPLIVNIAAVPKLTEQGYKWVFRNFPTGPMIVKDAFINQKALFEMTGVVPKTVTLLHVNDTFGSSLAGALAALTPKFKMPYEIVEKIAYDGASRDLSAEIRKVKGTNAEALWVVSRLNDAILLTKELVKQRYEPMGIFSTGPGWYETDYMRATKKYGNDVINLVPWFDAKKPLSKTLEAAFLKAHPDRTLNTNHAYTFEAVMIAAQAHKQAGSTDATALQAALKGINITDNVTTGAGISFDEKGQNLNVRNSAIQNRDGKSLVILPKEAAVTEPIWPMRGWNDRG
jgi:branched-chain amino acid transport system substrate-binding protein